MSWKDHFCPKIGNFSFSAQISTYQLFLSVNFVGQSHYNNPRKFKSTKTNNSTLFPILRLETVLRVKKL